MTETLTAAPAAAHATVIPRDVAGILEGEDFTFADLHDLRRLVFGSMSDRDRLREIVLDWDAFAQRTSDPAIHAGMKDPRGGIGPAIHAGIKDPRSGTNPAIHAGIKDPRGGTNPAIHAGIKDPRSGTNRAQAAVKEGVGYWLLGDVRRAIELLDRSRDDAVACWVLGRAYMEVGDAAKAQAAFDAACAADPRSLDALSGAVEARQAQDRHDETAGLLERIRSIAGEGAYYLYQKGLAAYYDGDYVAASAFLDKALQVDSGYVPAAFRRAFLYDRSGDETQAISMYERARRGAPTHTNVLLNLGVLYEDSGEWDRAEACYQEILKTNPNHPRARLYVDDVKASKGQFYDRDQERRLDRRNQILRTPVTDFELSVRSRNCLNKMNINCLGDLIKKSEQELLSYKNFGETSLQEIKDMLSQKGLRLGMGLTELENETTIPIVPRRGGVQVAEETDDILMKPLADLEFSVRSRKCMERLGLVTVGDLTTRTETELLSMKNFGQTSLLEVKQKIGEIGLRLRDGR